jgi:hypothetical protein
MNTTSVFPKNKGNNQKGSTCIRELTKPIINAYRCLFRRRGKAETGDKTKFTINQKDIVSEYVPAIPHVEPKIKPKI